MVLPVADSSKGCGLRSPVSVGVVANIFPNIIGKSFPVYLLILTRLRKY